MKKVMVILLTISALLAFDIRTENKVNADGTCTECSFNAITMCRRCAYTLWDAHMNCWAVCDFCEAWMACYLTPTVTARSKYFSTMWEYEPTSPTKQYLSPVAFKLVSTTPQEERLVPIVNLRFEKKHIVELAKKDLTLAFVVARTQIHSKPVGETVAVQWTPVDVSQKDLIGLLGNDPVWLEGYINRAKQLGAKGVPAADFKIIITKAANHRLKYVIGRVGEDGESIISEASFDMVPTSKSDSYISTGWSYQKLPNDLALKLGN